MRAKLALIPLVAGLALLGACAAQNGTGATPTSPAATTPAGNGIASLTADEIGKKAHEALTKQKAFHLEGKVTEDAEELSLDLTFSDGNVAGIIGGQGIKLDIVSIGDELYIKGLDDMIATLVPDPTVARGLKDKYMKINGKDPQFASFKEMADLDKIVPTNSTFTKGEAKTINGVPAIALVEADKSVMYVATEGEPLPLQMVGPNGTDTVTVTYQGVTPVKAPDPATVLDLTAMMGKTS